MGVRLDIIGLVSSPVSSRHTIQAQTSRHTEQDFQATERGRSKWTLPCIGGGGAARPSLGRVEVNFPELFRRELRWSVYDSYPDESDTQTPCSVKPRQSQPVSIV